MTLYGIRINKSYYVPINPSLRRNNTSRWNNSFLLACYLALFPISFFGIYYAQPLATVANIIIVLFSYWLICINKELFPVLFLLIYTRCINGFIIPGDPIVIKIVTLLTAYFPFLLYAFLWRSRITSFRFKNIVKRYFFTFLYVACLFIFSFFDPKLSMQLFLKRLMPMIMLLLALLVINFDVEWKIVRKFLRYLFISCLLIFLFSDYTTITMNLLANGTVFGKEANVLLTVFDINKNMGFSWDHRILALFASLFLLQTIISKPYRFKYFDIILAMVSLASTFSRGSIVLSLVLILGVTLQYRKKRLLLFVFFLMAISSITIATTSDELANFFASFNPFADEGNALSQRGAFREYALNAFYDNPLGSGVGYLSAEGKDRIIDFGTVTYSRVGDAFLFIQLAEIGFLGFFLFCASIVEILYKKTIISACFIIGIFILMTGTDVPDMGFNYFSFLLLSNFILEQSRFVGKSKIQSRQYCS